jgi:hypothetical protein
MRRLIGKIARRLTGRRGSEPESPAVGHEDRAPDDVAGELGRKFHLPVADVLKLEGDFIVLLDPQKADEASMPHNLFRLRADGTVVWTISQRGSMGVVTKVEWQYGSLLAWASRGYILTLNERSGKVRKAIFVK